MPAQLSSGTIFEENGVAILSAFRMKSSTVIPAKVGIQESLFQGSSDTACHCEEPARATWQSHVVGERLQDVRAHFGAFINTVDNMAK